MITSSLLLLFFCSISAGLLFEGDNCIVVATKGAGKCINIHQCQYARQLLKIKQNPFFCGFDGKTPLVCCPQNKQTHVRNEKTSRKKCLEYHGQRLNEVTDHLKEKVPREFPHMAAIGFGDNITSLIWLCAGSLISHYFVLAAAHCAHSALFGPATYVRLGNLHVQNTTLNSKIVQTYIHPEYKLWSRYHDVALFKLDRRVFFHDYIRPACIHTQADIAKVLQVIGWGKFGEDTSSLMEVVDKETCAERYAHDGKLEHGVFDEYQICARDSSGCLGDSGGPLHYKENETDEVREHFVLVGITSFGTRCETENTIGIYTRVSSYTDWIESIVWAGND